MNKESFEEFENLCSAVFGNVGNGNTPEARERLESICLQPSFVEKAETIFQNSKNIYALHVTGTSLTTIMTEYWNNFDLDQKLRIRDFILEYVIHQGYQLPSHITSVLCTLICRITSLSWMVDPRQRSIFDLMLQYTNSRENSVLALTILKELVDQINPTDQSSIQQNKTAIQFRDSNLLNIIQLSFNLLKETSQQDDATIGSSQLRYDIYDHCLQLLIRCCSFDCKVIHMDDTMDNHPIITLPTKWLPQILNVDNVCLLNYLYEHCSPPLTSEVNEVLLWLLSATRSDIFTACEDNNLLEVITNYLLSIMSSGYCLDDPETIHSFVQLLDRYKAICSIRQYSEESYQNVISCTANLTQLLINNIDEYSNSIAYLLHYWYKLCIDIGHFSTETYQPLRSFLQTTVLSILRCYMNKRLNDVPNWIQEKEDDPLMNTESIYWELLYIGSIFRFQYDQNISELLSLFDDINKQYMNDYRQFNTMKMTGVVPDDLLQRISTYECKLAWLITIIAFIIKGEKFTSSQMEKEEEILDADLCKRVFALNHSIVYRSNGANYSRIDPRLEISFIAFFNSFREVFSSFTKQGVTDTAASAIPILSGIKMNAFNRFFEKMGIGDFTSVMNTIVEKVCSNLRNWSDCDKVVEVSLHLFLDLSEPYYGCKLLLQLESIDFMLQNHTEETFKFLASPSLLNLRTTYYAALTKLVLMDNVPGRLEMFLAPFSALLQRLINEVSNINSYSLVLIKVFKDLRGVVDSCNDKRSYSIVFETLFENLIKVMNITVDYYCTNDELIGCMLKCLQSFVMNNNSRVDSGSTSTHGIILFKNTANLICCYVQRRLLNNIDYNVITESLFRCIRLVLQIMYFALNGKYVPFGVFALYNDSCLRNSLEACMTVVLQLPSYQVSKRQKLSKATYNFIDILFTNHLETLSQMSSEYFINLVRFVVNGIDAFDVETVAHCADCVDQLATYYYLNRRRNIPTMQRLQNIVTLNPTLWKDLFEKIMNSLLFTKGSSDILSRPIQSIFLVDAGVAESYYNTIARTQPAEVVGKLKDSMLKLTTNMDVTLEPTLRDQFCEKCRDFKSEVLSYLVL